MQKSYKNILLISFITIALIGYFIYSTKEDKPEASLKPTNTQTSQNASLKKVKVQEFQTEIQDDGAVILDIRTPEEFNSGRIQGAINIDFYGKDFESKLAELDPSTPYKLYCNSGNRSANALDTMKKLGFTDVVELEGGIVAWNKSKLPVCNDC